MKCSVMLLGRLCRRDNYTMLGDVICVEADDKESAVRAALPVFFPNGFDFEEESPGTLRGELTWQGRSLLVRFDVIEDCGEP